MIVGYNAER